MPKELCSVKYNDLDAAVAECLRLVQFFKDKFMEGKDGKQPVIFLGKTDLSSAFRVLLLKVKCYCWLIFKATDPKSGTVMYFVKKCLPFGASISCLHYQRFSNALQHIMIGRVGGKDHAITNYLDDFLFMALIKAICNNMIEQFIVLCNEINIPVAFEKTKWADTLIVFLGILMDGELLSLSIPTGKQVKAVNLLTEAVAKKKVTIKQLQTLTGYLNFITKAVFAGRTFTRRMYTKYAKLGGKLKPHHHIRLDAEFRFDCQVWLTFLANYRNQAICRPMVDLNKVRMATEIKFYSDASTNPKLGFGAIFGQRWISEQWGPGFIVEKEPSIGYLELFALTAALLTWGHHIINDRIVIFCDNMSVVNMINNCTSNCKNCMYLLRLIMLNNLIYNRRVFCPLCQDVR